MSGVKLCIAGKNDIAVDVLEYALMQNIYQNDEVVVICNKTETGVNDWQKSLRYYSQKWGIKEISLEDAYTLSDIIFLSLEFDRIVKPHKFMTKHLYNIHFSALPKYKGMYTSALPILNHEKETGVTFHKIDNGIDTGDIVDQIIFPIEFNDTARDLYLKYIKHGTQLAISELKRIKELGKNLPAIKQDGKESTYYSRKAINYSNPIIINLNDTALGVHDQIRAFSFREYQMPKVFDKTIVGSEITEIRSIKKAGSLILSKDNYMLVATIDFDIKLYYQDDMDMKKIAGFDD